MEIDILKDLNSEQLKAVTATDGPMIILAGAGSGKTRVLTYKVIYLIQKKNIDPTNILMVTFTNKAANEMKERILKNWTLSSILFLISTMAWYLNLAAILLPWSLT